MLYQIIKETGWTWHYVLWKVSRANLLLMMADRAGFKHVEKEDQVIEDTGAALFNKINRGKN